MSERAPNSSNETIHSHAVESTLVVDTEDMARENAARKRKFSKTQKAEILADYNTKQAAGLGGIVEGPVNVSAQAVFAAMEDHASNKQAEAEDQDLIKKEIAFNQTDFDRLNLIQDISKSHKYGRTQVERDAMVERSKSHLEDSMLKTGLDWKQASLALFLRLGDIENEDKLIDVHMARGKTEQEAADIAVPRYEKIDEQRKQFILENDIHTPAEYHAARDAEKARKEGVKSERTENYKTFGEGYRDLESLDPGETVKSAAKKVVEAWDAGSTAESPLLDKKVTERVLATCFQASKNLIEGVTPIHQIDPTKLDQNEDLPKLRRSLDVLARSRGCEDEALIEEYIDNEVYKVLNTAIAYENSDETVISDDKEAIMRNYKRFIEPQQGIPYSKYVNHEGTALIKAPVGFIVPSNPLDSDAVSEGNPDPGENPLPAVDRTPAPRTPRTETTGTRAETKERRKKMAKKFRALGALALVGIGSIGYAVGRVHDNFMIKNKDTPVVDTINKGQDNLRDAGVSYEDQEEIGRNWGAAESLFSHSPYTVEQDMGNLQDAYETKLQEVVKNNPDATPDQASGIAKAMVEADMIAAPINN